MAIIMRILDQFEAKAHDAIAIDASIKCDNYESVGRLMLIDKIRKAIATAYRTPPQHPNCALENLLSKGRINF
jgi:hypothetical protein